MPNPGDHYKFWKVDEVAFARTVRLKGQFDKEEWPARIDSVQYLANPVSKNNEPIHYPRTHLVAYRLAAEPDRRNERRWVTFTNQFGAGRWILTDPFFLLVPAGKTFPPETPGMPPPNTVDHFVCYVVRETDPVTREVTLVDQFDRRREKRERITRLEPAFFGVPVSKNNEPIINPAVHLTIYDIVPTDTLNPPFLVWTKDQLRPSILTARESKMLAVPSEKTGWGPDDGGDIPT